MEHPPACRQAGPADEPTCYKMSAGVPDCLQDTVIPVPFNDIDALKKAIAKNSGEIAAFILEPIMANATVILPKKGYLEEVRKITEDEGIVLIFDEVICGARCAWGGSTEAVGVTPDMVVLSKAIGGGYPVSVFGGKRAIMEHIEVDTNHGGTFGANTLVNDKIKCTVIALNTERLLPKVNSIYVHFVAKKGTFYLTAYTAQYVCGKDSSQRNSDEGSIRKAV